MKHSAALLAFAALAHESRLAIFRLLVQTGPAGIAAGLIAERLTIPAATLSFHLSHLKQAGLVTVKRDGRSLIYAAKYPAMTALLAYLSENCCQGDPSACAAPAAAKPRRQPARAAS